MVGTELKPESMKKTVVSLIAVALIVLSGCNKDDESERFKFLTGTVWVTDLLLANGVDASGPGQMLEDFKGEARFNKDGTGEFGTYTGEWRFAYNETQIIIETTDLPLPLSTMIEELTASSLKITTSVPNPLNPQESVPLRMTFTAKQ